jgi:hypothetical protein
MSSLPHRRALVLLALAGVFAGGPSLAQARDREEKDRDGKSSKDPTKEPGKEDKRDERPAPGMRGRVFQIKHQNAGDLVQALRPLSSGAAGAMFQPSEQLNIITVRDFPESLNAIGQALKRLDVPTPPQPDVEVRIRVLLGSPLPGTGQYPAELESVVKQLNATLQYKSYHQVAAVTQRVRAGSGSSGKGQVMIGSPAADESTNGEVHFSIEKISLPLPGTSTTPLFSFKRLKVRLESGSLGEAEVSTGLTLREEEKGVLGNGSLKNRGMIVVVSARLLRRP